MIELINLHKSFGKKKVLDGASLTINKGETLTIIGRSGVGKSVMLKHIIRLLEPDSGDVLIDGQNVLAFSRKELMAFRRRFGMLFQGAALFDSMTVDENVGLSLREHTEIPEPEIREIVSKKLRSVGLKDVEHLKPAELSGGMKKRVGLARAIAMNPEYILYDEPTTGLDPIMADAINELIIRMREELNVTSICVTHDMVSAYKISDRIAMIYEGKIIFTGSPDEVKSTDNPIVQQFIQGKAEGPIKAV
ncbi:MAG: ABC transporter ATP-binding protein [candidate division Zixibacteria bacterium CG_4_9_14_3_um_filter_46_8]|nr:MAG: ABC transporter ATP-binding protein [candidate division Zixibacteria bacterium CG_4_9_14_3_um_filter_46_8]